MTISDEFIESLTPAQRKQIADALLLYQAQDSRKVKWGNYAAIIRKEVGLDENDPTLNASDPRHWIRYGHEPKTKKLKIYWQFVQKVFPNFRYSDTRDEDFIFIAQTFSRFGNGRAKWQSFEAKECAEKLVGKVFVSAEIKDFVAGEKILRRFAFFKGVASSPVLIAYTFDFLVDHQDIPSGITRIETDLWQRDTLRYLVTEGLISPETIVISNTKRGVLAPLPDFSGFHGILHTDDYIPSHVQVDFERGPFVFRMQSTYPDLEYGFPPSFSTVDGIQDLKRLFLKFGDPLP